MGALGCLAALGCLPGFPDPPAGWTADLDAVDNSREADIGPDAQRSDRGIMGDMASARPDAEPSRAELCNGWDDDRDGLADEVFSLGMPCMEGQGACAAGGVTICRDDGMGTRCDAVVGAPSAELCNGIDDGCSGIIDEGFNDELGDACSAGEGACRAEGMLRCAENGEAVECSAQPVEADRTLERCNGRDDDCDGVVDNGLIRSCSIESVGICVAGRQSCSNGAWLPCVGDIQPAAAELDRCDGLDSDCDGIPDEDVLPDGNVPCDQCEQVVAGCEPTTGCVEQCDPASDIFILCAPAPEVDCDGRDDDCDGVIDDDGVCGRPIADTCTFGLGWTTEAVASPTAEWGDCSIDVGGFGDRFSCNGTQGDGFVTIGLPGGADLDAADDALGVALRCGQGAVGDYIVGHCRVVLGVATAAAAVADGAESWGGCPERRVDGDEQRACTSNSEAGEFLPMPLPFDLDADALMGVAFICDDPADADRARALQSSVAVSLAWADASIAGEIDWEAACAPLGDGEPYTACATTRSDGRFRVLQLTADVDGGDHFAIRLRRRAP